MNLFFLGFECSLIASMCVTAVAAVTADCVGKRAKLVSKLQ